LREAGGHIYLANHSLGRPLDRTSADVEDGLSFWYRDLDRAWADWQAEMVLFRARVATLINAPGAHCIVPKASAGQGLRAVLNCHDAPLRVIATANEFNSIDLILKAYAARGRIKINWIRSRADRRYRADDLATALHAGADLQARGGLPGPGFFDCARRLGRFVGDPDGQDARTFHAAELNAVFACWGGHCFDDCSVSGRMGSKGLYKNVVRSRQTSMAAGDDHITPERRARIAKKAAAQLGNVSPVTAEESEEVRGIGEDLPRFTEAGLAAELAPDGGGLGKVAGGDVVPDLVPFGRRQYPPQGLVRPHEAVEICGPILVDTTRRFVEQEDPAGTGGAADRLHQVQLVIGRQVMDRQAAPGRVGMLRPAQHGFDEIAVVEIDLKWQLGEIGSGEIKGCLRQVDAVIVADLGSAQRGLHDTGVAAGNVEEAEGRRENTVQGFPEDSAHRAVGQAIAFDQLAICGPLLLELRKRRSVHHCAAGLELMDMNVYQVCCLTSLTGEQAGPRGRADGGQGFNRHPPDDRGLDAQIGCMWPFWQG
jgi:hypothetical protein